MRIAKFAVIAGTVRDDHGEPLAGVPLVALKRAVANGSFTLSRPSSGGNSAETDDRGAYRIAQLPPGDYVVFVGSATTALPAAVAATVDAEAVGAPPGMPSQLLAPAWVTTGEGVRVGDLMLQRTGPTPPPPAADGKMLAYATTFAPGTTDAREAAVITLASGDQRVGVDLALGLWPAVRVSGVVTGPSGPMKNQAVRLVPPVTISSTPDVQAAGTAMAITDDKGAFTFPAVTPGSYFLKSTFVVYGKPATQNPVDVSLSAMEPLTVADTDISGLAVTLKPGFSVSGRLEFKGGESPVTGPGWIVALMSLDKQDSGPFGRVNVDGSFTATGNAPGRYRIQPQGPAGMPSASGWSWLTTSVGGKVVPGDIIDLQTDLSGVVFTISKEMARVSGSVVDGNGAADGETDVVLFPADATLRAIMNWRLLRSAKATPAGAFELLDLVPGDYYIAAVRSRIVNDWELLLLERLIPGATKIAVGESEKKTIQLKTFMVKER